MSTERIMRSELARMLGVTEDQAGDVVASLVKAKGQTAVDAPGKPSGKAGDAGKPSKAERRIQLAQRHGYQGTPAELEAKGRAIRRAIRELPTQADQDQAEALGKAQMDQLLAMTSAQRMTLGMTPAEIAALERSLAADDAELEQTAAPTPTPTATTPTPTPAATELGWNSDRTAYRATQAQLRDPKWCQTHQAELSKVQIADGPSAAPTPQTGEAFNPYQGLIPMDHPLRDPAWCFANQAKVQAKSKEVMHLPLSRAGDAMAAIT
jgi:hypothetical protein